MPCRTHLDQAELTLKNCFDRVNLRMVELGQTCYAEAFGQIAFHDHVFDFVPEELVIDVGGYRVLVDGERL